LALLVSCAPETSETHTYQFALDISEPHQQRILDLQDRQQRDSLVAYLEHPDPSLRYRAAMAFASFRDSAVIQKLAVLLDDKDAHVRMAAAYALGQSRARQAEPYLIKGFRQMDSLPSAALSNAFILEAVGKTGGVESLTFLSTTTSYLSSDSLLILGQARGIYRFALRGIIHPSGTLRMVAIVSNPAMPHEARIIAANYLFRATGISTTDHVAVLAPLAESDRDPRIRMCLVVAIAKAATPVARQTLSRMLSRDQDYRVKCNILRSLHYFPYEQVDELAFQNLANRNLHVARAAAMYLLEYGSEKDAARYRSVSKSQLPWEVKSLLYGASNRFMSGAYAITKTNLNTELREWFERAKDPYEKAAVLDAFAKDAGNFDKIPGMAFDSKFAPVRTAAVDALGNILEDKRFVRDIGTNITSAKRAIANHLVAAIRTGDPAMIASAATSLAKTENGLYEYARAHLETLESALIALDLPAEIESYDALADCLAKLKNEKYSRQTPSYNHPIPWNVVSELPDIVNAEIITPRGTIKVDLFTRIAPGTVMNFVQLARDRFYHGKNFHRVVPNFVIQGGCPRGDGYGSLDYSIRSELPSVYYNDEGYLGMASAGNHTEGTQWFIIHSPTPHLDGNYTLFGKVTSGMDVVHAIQIGDEIMEVNVQ
jgi:cyclophilin family peptidyl-prolyl cis-trans isomerase/HEAT repeat protein